MSNQLDIWATKEGALNPYAEPNVRIRGKEFTVPLEVVRYMEMQEQSIAAQQNEHFEIIKLEGEVFNVPRNAVRAIMEIHQAYLDARKDADRQMAIQMQTSRWLRQEKEQEKPAPDAPGWIPFAYHFPAVVAFSGIPSVPVLCAMLVRRFGLSHLTFREYTYCIAGNPRQKAVRITWPTTSETEWNTYRLVVSPDDTSEGLLEKICQALIFIEYDFEIPTPLSAIQPDCQDEQA